MASKIFGVLMCAKCNKPVDTVESSIDPSTGDYVFTAFCHGKSESCVLTRRDIDKASSIHYDRAFTGSES
jgi:hypothetical protein